MKCRAGPRKTPASTSSSALAQLWELAMWHPKTPRASVSPSGNGGALQPTKKSRCGEGLIMRRCSGPYLTNSPSTPSFKPPPSKVLAQSMGSGSDRLGLHLVSGTLGSPMAICHKDSTVCAGTWYISAQKVLAVSTERVSMAWLTQNPPDHHGVCCDGTTRSPFRICWGCCWRMALSSPPSMISSIQAQGHTCFPRVGCLQDRSTYIKASPLTPDGDSPIFSIPQRITGELCPSVPLI